MTKKIGLFVLSFIAIFSAGVGFADVIPSPNYGEQSKDRACITSEGIDVGDNKFIIMDYESGKIHELSGEYCINGLRGHNRNVFFLDKSIDINSIDKKNIREMGKLIDIMQNYYSGQKLIGGSTAPSFNKIFYKIGYNPTNDSELVLIDIGIKDIRIAGLPDFPGLSNKNEFYGSYEDQILLFVEGWLLTIIIETIVLFLIAKFCRKLWIFRKGKLIITGILTSTITLPLLWFVFPMFFRFYWIYVIFGEILVAVIETFIIKYSLKIKWEMAIFASIICNLCSFLIGLLIF